MKLAWSEMKYYKFRFILITLIILLLATMVLFISGLAQGLGRENVSMLDNMKATNFIMENNKKPQIEQSTINKTQKDQIENIVSQKPLNIASQTLDLKKSEETVTMIDMLNHDNPKLKQGHYPKNNTEMVINEKLVAQGIDVGDKVKLKSGEKLTVSGVLKDTMYAHSSVVMMNHQGFDKLNHSSSTIYPVNHITKKEKNEINNISGITITNKDDIKNAIPSYQAEQSPLNLMVVSLLVISAIVLSAFFYVMTIQKISEIGILKAIGIRTSHLISALLTQIIVTTLIGVIVAIGLILSLSMVMPVSMPFHINAFNLIIVLAIFVIVAIIGALLSLIKVFKVDPIDAIGGME
ncbi:FtsX-like permease family protein [Staphylococcus sp. ACRSN]|uniref:ABC transporter permease n=1 Tax=Staphylococcus sp. ACRSN TaxID=2918214 RepID=UPI001EF3297D|nr:ABC transporter permease [Staphylococcus sp. ACRSN]MCG7338177.1 FtsX-like permease family protein [Staphylococcus sp. ACRSN]